MTLYPLPHQPYRYTEMPALLVLIADSVHQQCLVFSVVAYYLNCKLSFLSNE
ncbi:unnamed protein product [Brugia timori]|uniref:Uncharacterized protein n=1 Tax=Brugia timori TaxID=42155 RepID=A0A0R3Q882_9BILA|nr:unnamed protein product [Brugia timori]